MDTDVNIKEYLDKDDALKRIGGNEGLYKKLLARFVDGDYLDVLCTALQSGDTEESARAAHTLKGVSANLSLIKIRDISMDLEQEIKNGADYAACLDELKQAFDVTLEIVAEIMN